MLWLSREPLLQRLVVWGSKQGRRRLDCNSWVKAFVVCAASCCRGSILILYDKLIRLEEEPQSLAPPRVRKEEREKETVVFQKSILRSPDMVLNPGIQLQTQAKMRYFQGRI